MFHYLCSFVFTRLADKTGGRITPRGRFAPGYPIAGSVAGEHTVHVPCMSLAGLCAIFAPTSGIA